MTQTRPIAAPYALYSEVGHVKRWFYLLLDFPRDVDLQEARITAEAFGVPVPCQWADLQQPVGGSRWVTATEPLGRIFYEVTKLVPTGWDLKPGISIKGLPRHIIEDPSDAGHEVFAGVDPDILAGFDLELLYQTSGEVATTRGVAIDVSACITLQGEPVELPHDTEAGSWRTQDPAAGLYPFAFHHLLQGYMQSFPMALRDALRYLNRIELRDQRSIVARVPVEGTDLSLAVDLEQLGVIPRPMHHVPGPDYATAKKQWDHMLAEYVRILTPWNSATLTFSGVVAPTPPEHAFQL
jgi:hypothetical protein